MRSVTMPLDSAAIPDLAASYASREPPGHPRARAEGVLARPRHLVQRRRGRGAHRHGGEDRRALHGVLARHRPPASRDVPVPREGAHALRHRDRDGVPAAGGGAGARAREGALLLLRRRPQGVLRHPQGGAADARARAASRVGDGAAQGSEPGHARRRAGRSARPHVRHARAAAREVQPAQLLDLDSRSGATSASTTCRTTRCTIAASSRSAASRARAPPTPASTSAQDDGGGKRKPRRSAACTRATCAEPPRQIADDSDLPWLVQGGLD